MILGAPLLAVKAEAAEADETWTHRKIGDVEVSLSTTGEALYHTADGCVFRTDFDKKTLDSFSEKCYGDLVFDLVPQLVAIADDTQKFGHHLMTKGRTPQEYYWVRLVERDDSRSFNVTVKRA